MFTLLALLSALVVVLFFGVVAVYLLLIARTLEAIGGEPDSLLAKLRWGLRAIEQETSHLPREVTQLNETMTALGQGLTAVEGHLAGTAAAVGQQRAGR